MNKLKVLINLSKSTAQGPILYCRRANDIYDPPCPPNLAHKVAVEGSGWQPELVLVLLKHRHVGAQPPPSATHSHSLLCNCHSDLTDPAFPLIWSVLIETQILLVHFLHNCAWWQSPWAACRTRSLISTCIQVYLHLTSKIKYTCPPLECSIFFTRHFHISQRCYFHFRL